MLYQLASYKISKSYNASVQRNQRVKLVCITGIASICAERFGDNIIRRAALRYNVQPCAFIRSGTLVMSGNFSLLGTLFET